MPKPLADWRGKPIEVGSVVVYPSRQRADMWMNQGEVVSIVGTVVGVRKKDGNGRTAYPHLQRLTIVDD